VARVQKKESIIEKLFFHIKPAKMLIALKNEKAKYVIQLSKVVDCTYSHTVKVLEFFKKLGLVTFEKKGRIKFVKLTQDGEEIAHDLEGLMKKIMRISSRLKEEQTVKEKRKKK
jgi:DNA-binding transcriptional ArsR family regulator